MAFDRKRYPPDWPLIRKAIQQRAKNRCERCGVPNYAVGYRDSSGAFHPAQGNGLMGQAGRGELDYKAARHCMLMQREAERRDPRQRRWIVVVCTTAHLKDMDKQNTDPSNLAFLCQYHHLAIDRPHHLAVQRRNREARKRQRQPVLFEEAG